MGRSGQQFHNQRTLSKPCMCHDFSNSSSTDYYEEHAQVFFEDTVALDLSPLYARFLNRLPAGGHILDAGCGSGRDTRVFLDRGYAVTAVDASPALARLASTHYGIPVQVMRFQEIDWRARFDGIWACASLLHVPMMALPDVLRRLAVALKPQGVLYASFKYGQGEREHNARRFTDLDEAGLVALLQAAPYFTVLDTWTTADRRPGRAAEIWLNTLLKGVIAEVSQNPTLSEYEGRSAPGVNDRLHNNPARHDISMACDWRNAVAK